MRKVFIFISFLALCMTGVSQTDGLSYQALILDNQAMELPGHDMTGQPLSDGDVTLKFTIFDQYGNMLYQELQAATTDAYGLINVIIGQGTPSGGSGTFVEIEWDGNPMDLQVELAYEALDFELLSLQGLYFLPFAYHRNIVASGNLLVEGDAEFLGNTNFNSITVQNLSDLLGDVNVGGETNLNGPLNVNNGSPTNLSGDLGVEGNLEVAGTTNLMGDAYVDGSTDLNGTLNVQGNTTLGNGLQVTNGSNTYLSGELEVDQVATFGDNVVIDEQLTVHDDANLNGQVTINYNMTGADTDYSKYALRVEGSQQGVAIKTSGNRNSNKNYVTFYDAQGIHGRIEGQTSAELTSSFRFIWDFTMAGLDEGFALAEALACGFNVPPDAAEVVSNGAQAIAAYAQWVELTDYQTSNVGVLFSSGGADYAEWLEKKNPNEQFFPGEVVGVYAGKISKNTAGAHELKVVSTNPIVLGNMPEEGAEARYEQIAFLGQAPCRVMGPVSEGDYLLPSGNNDGFAKAYSPEALPTARFHEIIGIAWESGNSEGVNLVNSAVGLNTNDLASRVAAMETEMQQVKQELAELKRLILGDESIAESLELNENQLGSEPKNEEKIGLTDAEFEQWLSQSGAAFEQVMSEKRAVLEQLGSDYAQYPEIAKIIDTPLLALREMRAGTFMNGMWPSLENKIQQR